MKRRIVNTLGSLGYVSLIIQWVWMIIILGMPIMVSDGFRDLFLPNRTSTPVPTASISIPEPIAILFLILAVIFTIGVSIYVIVAVPRAVGRTGNTVTKTSAQVIIPKITHHKKISEKREKTLVERITWSMKIGATAIPVPALMVPPPSDLISLPQDVVTGVGLFCASLTVLWFGAQFVLSKFFSLRPQDIW